MTITAKKPRRPLYTPAERARRDTTVWTRVQAVLAPIQFAVFIVSAVLVLRYLATGAGLAAAEVSVLLKTLLLYLIMVTGAIWERAVFGRYLFARPFFWEDIVSTLVLALHTAYVAVLALGMWSPRSQMFLALLAYVAYLVNAAQYLIKLRAARAQVGWAPAPAGAAR
jgi:3-vinyl bacteriochlorophyllide hydratase